jgi:Flp pilus assembly pilin Flp
MTTSTPDSPPDRRSVHAPLRRSACGGAVRRRPALDDDRGSATAEYAVVILAAVAFAGVLVAVMRSGEVQAILTDLVRGALSL